MHRFEIYADNTLIGHSELEFGDPPMGVAFGRFYPTDAYAGFQPRFVAAAGADAPGLSVTVRLGGGPVLPCSGGVGIQDCSAELGAEGIEVSALGISYPAYEELFPQHVASYEAQFR